MNYEQAKLAQPHALCWHCGKNLPKDSGEAIWVWNKKREIVKLKAVLHQHCFLKIGGIL